MKKLTPSLQERAECISDKMILYIKSDVTSTIHTLEEAIDDDLIKSFRSEIIKQVIHKLIQGL